MKEIVDQVLKEEELARQNIQKAREQAEQIVDQARKSVQAILDEKVEATEDSCDKKNVQAEKDFIAERDRTLQQAREQSLRWRLEEEKAVDEIARKVFSCITRIEK
jgi:F0F1-type ATP synthase membrane subunit b/b'